MRNPLAYLKHIVKDPITNIAEADARKKEIMPLFYGSAGLLVAGVVLQIAAKLDFMAAVSFAGLVGVAFCAFLFSVIKSAKRRFEALTCNRCNALAEIKSPEDFARYVSFVVEKDEAIFKGYSGNKEPTNGVYSLIKFSGSSSAVLSVALTCPHCGEVKQLKYYAEPFKCHAEATKVGALQYTAVSASLETAVKTAVNDYNDPSKKGSIPYTFHSSKNPNFENRYSFKGSNGHNAHPGYMGARIDYHKDVEEMLEHYFVLNELSGTLKDPNGSAKKKLSGGGKAVSAPNAQKSEHKSDRKPIVAILAVCAVLVAGGLIYGFVSAGQDKETKDDATKTTTESTLAHSDTEPATDPVEKININDYVGYWHIKENQEKELTIHNGNSDSVSFSLWYHEAYEISNVEAQLQDNVASFSMAAEGAIIKGALTFQKGAVIVHITQSTMPAMPIEEIEFTQLDMTSWAHSEEEPESTENWETEATTEPSQETQPAAKEVPYLFSAKNASYSIYSGPSYDSDFVEDLPAGTYTIVEEAYDENNNLWGKLKSGLGWICVEDGNEA